MTTSIRKYFAYSFLFALAIAQPVRAATYEIDAAHSTIGFKVRHLLTKVSGRFTKFQGTFDYDPSASAKVSSLVEIEAASIDTDNEKRDNHLRTKDFFEVEKYPKIVFKSTKTSDVKGNKMKLHGKLTMHGVTKDVVFDFEALGTATDPWGNKKAAFSGSTTINRKDYGLNWNQTLEAGGVLVGDEIEIQADFEANLKP